MRRELSMPEVIRAGRAQETRTAWERAREFAWALYGRSALRLTYSQVDLSAGDHFLYTIQALAVDAAGRLLPYDFTAPWWVTHDLSSIALASAMELTQDSLPRGLGAGLPDELRDELRAFAEERMGVETLHSWGHRGERDTLTWMFDLSTPPPFAYAEITDEDGAPLVSMDIIAAGLEREDFLRWANAREYVRTLYGDRAVKADVVKFSRYNDNTYDHDIRLDVLDADGRRLFFDLRLPWWERFALSEEYIATYAEERDSDGPVDVEDDAALDWGMPEAARAEIERLAITLLGADYIETRDPWDIDTRSYDLTQRPQLRFPCLWTQDSAG